MFCPSAIAWKMFPQPQPAHPEQDHSPMEPSGKEASCVLREAPAGLQGPEKVPNHAHCSHRAMPGTGKLASCAIHICGWENVQKIQEQSEGKEQRVQPRLGQASLKRQISGPGTSRFRQSHGSQPFPGDPVTPRAPNSQASSRVSSRGKGQLSPVQ